MDPSKDPTSYDILTYSWVLGLSMVGGVVSFMRKIREGKARAFNILELVGEIVTAGFAGVLTFWLCEAGSIDPLISAALVGIAGHMGSRTILLLEQWAESKLPKD
jgi:hypothetical protein